MLKALFQINYLYWLEKNVGLEERSVSNDCRNGGRLQISLEYVLREFNHVKTDGDSVGWVMDGLIARPLPNRIRLEHVASSIASWYDRWMMISTWPLRLLGQTFKSARKWEKKLLYIRSFWDSWTQLIFCCKVYTVQVLSKFFAKPWNHLIRQGNKAELSLE